MHNLGAQLSPVRYSFPVRRKAVYQALDSRFVQRAFGKALAFIRTYSEETAKPRPGKFLGRPVEFRSGRSSI